MQDDPLMDEETLALLSSQAHLLDDNGRSVVDKQLAMAKSRSDAALNTLVPLPKVCCL